jgi:hypothetical protein
MQRIILALLAITLLEGCAHVPSHDEAGRRPHLVLHGKEWNAPILNRRPPEYGINSPGGCVVAHEFRVEMDELTYNTATDRLRIRGQLTIVAGPAGGRLRTRDDSGRRVVTATGGDARFSLDLLLARNDTLTIEGLGMRTLHMDLRVLRRRASLAPTPPPVARP